ncbi:MAG: hypothetical protein D6752_05065 [Candidatus Nitrosothermus koennekii]|nr:MAG: hypothetical protein D6752_05065 [Candidatus Nitrosothermus koennekii]
MRARNIAIIVGAIVGGLIISSIIAVVMLSTTMQNAFEKVLEEGTLTITETVINDTITISAGEYKHYEFEVEPNVKNAIIEGNFDIIEDEEKVLEEGIKVLVLEYDDFVRWSNGEEKPDAEDDEPVASGSFSFGLLPPGKYVLVYDNTFGANDKTVVTNAVLSYIASLKP